MSEQAKTRRGSRGCRWLNRCKQEQENTENAIPPKIIIKKRPPRRPKLPDGSQVPCVPFEQAIESEAKCRKQAGEVVKNAGVEDLQVRKVIDQVEQHISVLKLSQESLANQPECVIPTPEKSTIENTKIRVRRPVRKRNKQTDDKIIQENINSNDLEIATAGTSTSKGDIETGNTSQENKTFNKVVNKSELTRVQLNQEHSPSNTLKGQNAKKEKRKRDKKVFTEHLPVDIVRKILENQDPNNPKTIEGHIRINPRNHKNAYVPMTGEQDVLIIGLRDRNRALEGDLVAVIINPEDRWCKTNENTLQKTGTVISILEKLHPRKAVGYLKRHDIFVVLQPRDARIPIVKIKPKTVPQHFYNNPELFEDVLFLCNIVEWKKIAFAEGEIEHKIGSKGDLSVETSAILFENDLVLTPYEDELLVDLPPADYIPTEFDIAEREDLRETCIFTIDPATAVDLDDAVSCKPLENGNFEVGIHIADVTHFLEEFSPLDRKVAERATTVYMVDNVYHMLPKQLCMACSLLPGRDKLAFSVILEMTPTAEVVGYRFAKSVINSCSQMAYEQAQKMIDDEAYDWASDGSLKIAGNYEPSDLVRVVRNLFAISTQLTKKRFEEGALRIDQPKLSVFLDPETRLPVSYKLDERKESNSLIEEFMLLANMTVAKYLYETMPEVALLRSHAEPSMRLLTKTRDLLTKFGVLLDVESAGSLYNSLLMYQSSPNTDSSSSPDVAYYRMMVINSLCAKSMTRATYKCSSSAISKDGLRHYALNAEFYTHFTSPIRRYPDCVVHRLLYASMKNQPPSSQWDPQLCKKVASTCNTKKYSAKMAQEASNTLYFTYMLDLQGSMDALAIVMDVKERAVDAMLCDTGLKVRLYFSDTIEKTTIEFQMDQDVPTVKLTWIERKIVQVINIFSILNVKITKHPQLFRLQGIILPPSVQVNAKKDSQRQV